jgi:hypothetical protein
VAELRRDRLVAQKAKDDRAVAALVDPEAPPLPTNEKKQKKEKKEKGDKKRQGNEVEAITGPDAV